MFPKRLLALSFLLFSTHSFAEDLLAMPDATGWHPLYALGVGIAHTSNLGTAQNFPVINGNDQNYTYRQAAVANAPLFDGFMGAERALSPNWSFQAGADYNQISTFDVNGTVTQGLSGNTQTPFSYDYSVNSFELLEENKLLYTFNDRYHPYLSGGLGVGFNHAYDYTTGAASGSNAYRNYGVNTTTTFAYRVGFGMDVEVSKHVRLGMGYRFADLGKVSLGKTSIVAGQTGATTNGTLQQNHTYVHEALAQLTYVM